MEKEIINIIQNALHDRLIENLYNSRATNYEFPPKFDIDKLPFDIVHDFNDEYFYKFRNILIENSYIYAVLNDDKAFLSYFEDNIDYLENALKDEEMFKIKLSEYAIKHIFNKYYAKIDDEFLKEKYKDILNKAKKEPVIVSSITSIYRDWVIDFIDLFDEKDSEIILDEILTTDKYDKQLIEFSNNILNQNTINIFKNIVFRLILTDNFLYLEEVLSSDDDDIELEIIDEVEDESSIKIIEREYDELDDDELDDELDDDIEEELDDELNDELEENEDFNDELDDDELSSDKDIIKKIQSKILSFIYISIKNNNFYIPNDFNVRHNLYSIFLTYNSYENDRALNIENINRQEEKRKALLKLNPYYMMDLIDGKDFKY